VIFDQVPVMLFGHPDGLVPEQLRHIGQLHTPHRQMRPTLFRSVWNPHRLISARDLKLPKTMKELGGRQRRCCNR
jgi:hypothetical protein